jgi:iron complex transport system substrate-binding protein
LPPPAGFERIVTLAPNIAELVFEAGAGDLLVGVSAYSDYPPEVLELPVIGDAFMIDHEQLALLNPDLLLVWHSGTPAHVVDELRNAGYDVRTLRTDNLDNLARSILAIGTLTGRRESAQEAVQSFTEQLDEITSAQDGKSDISVFYQVSRRPLFTVNGEHYISELISLCGGSNVFGDLSDLAPTIDVEAVVERDPEVIMASTDAGADAFTEWERWPNIAANRHGNRFQMPADAIGRATPRLVQAANAVCEALDEARTRRGSQ